MGGVVRALVIEDEALVAFLVEDFLQAQGFREIAVVATEAEAVSLAREFLPDLVTADARLASGCGITAALSICSEREVPVVFITGNEAQVRLRVAAPIIVEKPFFGEKLAAAIALARATPGVRPAATGR
jgi:DNA-binding response OmpR family regulator